MKTSCPICQAPAQDAHFTSTVPVCRACAAFFRRFVLSPKSTIKCKNEQRCEVYFKNSTNCRVCRMQKCLSAGMKKSAVQPCRDKYSTPRLPPEILPDIEPRCCSTPRLQMLHQNYLKLKSAREEFYGKKPGDKPKYRNIGEILEILRHDLKMVTKFIDLSYGRELGGEILKFEKKVLFQNFFLKNVLIEHIYQGILKGIREYVLPNGDFYDKDLGRFYTSHTRKSPRINKESAKIFFQPYWDEYDRTIVQDIEQANLDIFEFLTVSALIFWDTGLEDLSPKSVEKCLKMRAEIVSEIQIYYEKVKNVADPCIRLCQVMMLLPSIQKAFQKMQEELEMCGVLDIYQQIHNDAYTIINEGLNL